MEINPLTVLATMINFGIFYFIMRKILFKPVTEAISSREDDIKGRIKRAEEIEKQSEAIKLQNEERLNNARDEGKLIIEDLRHKAEKTADDIIIKAKAEAEFILERARTDAEREREKAEDEIKSQAINLALLLSSKALENTIDESEHRRLIKDFIAKVG